MKISVNCPSYRRPKVKTLDYLPYCQVWVDEGEAEEYRRENPGAKIIACPSGVQGNLCRVRNYIIKTELDGGADVVCIVDDDLSYIERFVYRDGFAFSRERLNSEEFLEMVEKYSIVAEGFGAKFWGMNCNADSLCYRHYTPFSTVAYIGGPFQVFLKGNRCWYDESLPLKEDYDMTLQQLNVERVVFRLNGYHYLCDQATIAGGCAAYRNREREEQQFLALQRKWGSKIVRRDGSNKGMTEKTKKYGDFNPIIRVPIKGV